jgi:acetyl-CoA synthetase
MSDNKPFEPQSNGDVYPPPAEFLETANVADHESKTKQAEEDLEGFWSERASELEWFKPWDKVLDDSTKPFYKWFTEG